MVLFWLISAFPHVATMAATSKERQGCFPLTLTQGVRFEKQAQINFVIRCNIICIKLLRRNTQLVSCQGLNVGYVIAEHLPLSDFA